MRPPPTSTSEGVHESSSNKKQKKQKKNFFLETPAEKFLGDQVAEKRALSRAPKIALRNCVF